MVSNTRKLILDVRSGSVSALILDKSKAGATKLILARRVRVPLLAVYDEHRLMQYVEQAISELLKEMRKQVTSLTEIHVCVSTPWVHSQAREVAYKPNHPFEINSKLISRLVAEETDLYIADLSSAEGTTDNIVIESEITESRLNGYVSKPSANKQIETLEMELFFSSIEGWVAKSIDRAIRGVYSTRDIFFHSFAYLAIIGTRMIISPSITNYLIINIGGEVSEIHLISEGVAKQSTSIPLGAHTISREISTQTGLEVGAARSMYEAYRDGRVSEQVKIDVELTINEVKLRWQTYIRNVLSKLATKYMLPSEIIIIGNPKTEEVVGSILQDPTFIELTSSREITTKLLMPTELKSSQLSNEDMTKLDVFSAVELYALEALSLM